MANFNNTMVLIEYSKGAAKSSFAICIYDEQALPIDKENQDKLNRCYSTFVQKFSDMTSVDEAIKLKFSPTTEPTAQRPLFLLTSTYAEEELRLRSIAKAIYKCLLRPSDDFLS